MKDQMAQSGVDNMVPDAGYMGPLTIDNIDPSRPLFERGDQAELARATLKALGPNPITYDAGEFWRYDPTRGVWDKVEGHFFRHTAARFSGAPVGQKQLMISAGMIAGAESIARDSILSDPARVSFLSVPPGVAFSNGFVTVSEGIISVLPHSSENRARHGFGFEYVEWTPDNTPLLCSFLEDIFADCSEDERAARISLLQEFAGASLVGDTMAYQQCLLLYGLGGNGKSALLSLLRAMFPPESLVSVAPQRWSERFGLAALEGKRANLVSETPTGEILDGSAFKAVITGDWVTAERKHKDPFDFKPTCAHIFSTNWPIITADHSEGFWRRPVVLPLTRRFEGDPSRKLGVEKDIIAGELAGIIAFAIEGARRAQVQKCYTLPSQSVALLDEWRDSSDQVRLYLGQRPHDEDVVRAGVLFDQYREWAKNNGHSLLSNVKFGMRVKATQLYDFGEDRMGKFYRRRHAHVPNGEPSGGAKE